ncbi:hypothetical protein [Kozakia baliensis]|uniref:hypothetical protein n=1 Tax=Kozakia baliensis TaxID=153496 RepID=UPI00068AD6FD|nr:hypothetical protein [Kozakia baliensis]
MAIDILAELALLLVPCWPLLAACLLSLTPTANLRSSAKSFALIGLIISVCLTPFMPGQDGLSNGARLLVACVPWLARRGEIGRIGVIVPFLACFCIMLALTAHAVLPIAALLGLAAALLALHEAAGAVRARVAWELARIRLAGAILALLGATLTGSSTQPDAARLGDLLLAVGLCLLAGLGPSPQGIPEMGRPAVLDMLLRIGALALMLRLPDRDVTHMVFLLAGLGTLWLAVLARQCGPRLHAALATLCAAQGGAVLPALLFMTGGLAICSGEMTERSARWASSSLPPYPHFTASLLLLSVLLMPHPFVGLAVLAALAIQAARTEMRWPTLLAWRQDAALWLLLALGLSSPLLMLLPWSLAWRPS